MVSVSSILKKIEPLKGKKVLVNSDQSTNDIIEGVLKTHKKYQDQYYKIAPDFWKGNIYQTSKAIWDFLKTNVKYWIEPENFQTLRSPAAIIGTGQTMGADCKSYALFAAGVLDGLRRRGIPVKWSFRFSSYQDFNKEPQHVFVVVNPGTSKEIWIDPVLDRFDYKKPYFHAIDKKMMYQISGVGATQGNIFSKIKTAVKKIDLKKVTNVLLKVPAAPARNAFLLLVDLNFRSVAKNLAIANQKNPAKLRSLWEGFGGSYSALVKAIDKGKNKKRLGQLGIAVETTAAAASPIIVAIVKFLKEVGIDANDLAQKGLEMAQTAVSNALNKGGVSSDGLQVDSTTMQTDGSKSSFLDTTQGKVIAVVAVAGVIYLISKKSK